MASLTIIEHSPFLTSVHSSLDRSILYTVTSRRHHDGYWVDVVHRVEQDSMPSRSERHKVHTELATVFYINAGTTRVRFRRNLEIVALGEQGMESEVEMDLDAFLRQRKPYSNSRVFMGPNGVTYKWRIDGAKLELIDTTTRVSIARFHPCSGNFSLPISMPGMTKRTGAAICTNSSTRTKDMAPFLHPTLSLHPALLVIESESNTPQLLDAIVLTFVIMQRLLKGRLQYRYLW